MRDISSAVWYCMRLILKYIYSSPKTFFAVSRVAKGPQISAQLQIITRLQLRALGRQITCRNVIYGFKYYYYYDYYLYNRIHPRWEASSCTNPVVQRIRRLHSVVYVASLPRLSS